MAITNDLSVTVQQLDSEDTVVVRNVFDFEDLAATVGERRRGILTDNTETTVSLPKTQIRQLFLKNLDAAALYTVKWTPTGGSKVTIIILGPGDGIMFWHQNTGATKGISLMTITSDTNQTQYYDMFLGG